MEFALMAAVLLMSIVAHEVAHAWQARREGDETAYRLGRITLNPLKHIDPIGSVIVPLLLWYTNAGFLFGWAKPVPVVPSNYRDYRAGDIRVSMAGIVVNLILAVVFTLLSALAMWAMPLVPSGLPATIWAYAQQAVYFGILINVVLALFNLVPIPPLDGSHVLYHFLPPAMAERYRAMGKYGIMVLMAMFFFVPGVFSILLGPIYFIMGLADAFIRLWI